MGKIVKTELQSSYRSEWPEITESNDNVYCGGSEAEQMGLEIIREGFCDAQPQNIKMDQSLTFPTPLSQVHNRSTNTSGKQDSLDFPWIQWTERQTKHDQLPLLSLPSLSSSGISSLRSDAEDTCPTPETVTNPGRLLGNSTMPYHTYVSFTSGSDQSMSIDSENEHHRMPGPKIATALSRQCSYITDANENAIDLVHWDPTKFKCGYCQERYLVESDLQRHLVTHKRYRNHLKIRRKNRILDIDRGPSADLSFSSVPSEPLSSTERQNIRNQTRLSFPNGKGNSDGISQHSRLQITLDQHIIALEGLQFSDSELPVAEVSLLDTVKSRRDRKSCVQAAKSNLSFRKHFALIDSTENYPIPASSSNSQHRCTITSAAVPVDILCANNRVEPDDASRSCGLSEQSEMHLFDLEMEVVSNKSNIQDLGLLVQLIFLIKQNLVSCIMREFMDTYKERLATNIRGHGTISGSNSNHDTQSNPLVSRKSSRISSSRGHHFNRDNDGNQDPSDGDEDDNPRAPKRPRAASPPMRMLNDGVKFACPYRKYDPRTYCVRNWRPCALTGLDSVARVKAHLYRHHRIYQCQRCKDLFPSQNVLSEHILALQGCPPNRVNLVEGLTADIEKKLRSRKKSHPSQTEAERWIEIYQILFPTSTPPSPFFEPVEETIDQVSDSAKLAELEAYTQRELPKLFWAALEEVVAKEMQPVEERLRSQLLSMIRDCQDRVFSTYQSMVSSTIETLNLDSSAKDKLLAQFEPLTRTTSAESQLRTGFSLSGLSKMSIPRGASNTAHGSSISGYNSSTTLSSIFNSSTTLSSVFDSTTTLSSAASSQVLPSTKPKSTAIPVKIDEMSACAFRENDENAAVTDTIPDDFWTTDLDETDFDDMSIWNSKTTLDEGL